MCTIGASDTGGVKMVLTLLPEVVAFHVRFTIIKARKTSL